MYINSKDKFIYRWNTQRANNKQWINAKTKFYIYEYWINPFRLMSLYKYMCDIQQLCCPLLQDYAGFFFPVCSSSRFCPRFFIRGAVCSICRSSSCKMHSLYAGKVTVNTRWALQMLILMIWGHEDHAFDFAESTLEKRVTSNASCLVQLYKCILTWLVKFTSGLINYLSVSSLITSPRL